ncbi:MAG TPA: acyloxyacyl hydrolase [Nitrospirota bacterium]
MRRRIAGLALALFFVLLLRPEAAAADGFFVESGPGVMHSRGSVALFLRYQRDAPALFGQAGFYEVSYGSWSGKNRNEAIALARGIELPSGEHGYLSFTAGLGVVRTTTRNLDTPVEFLLRGAYGRRVGRYDISLGFTHFSNGKFFFRRIHPPWWDRGPNFGENFPTLQLGVTF